MEKQLARGYRHFRNIELNGSAHNQGGVTLEYLAPAPLDQLPADAEVHVSIAICSRDDNFSFKVGRKLAAAAMGDSTLFCTGSQLQDLLNIEGHSIYQLRQKIVDGEFLTNLSAGERHTVLAKLASARLR